MRQFRKDRLPTEDGEAPKFHEFVGVVNARSRKDVGWGGLVNCTNLFVTDSKKVQRVPGYEEVLAGSVYGVWGGASGMYVAKDDGILFSSGNSVASLQEVVTGLTGRSFVWDEVNTEVFYVNGVDAGMLRGPQHLPLRVVTPSIISVELVAVGTGPTTANHIGDRYDAATWRFVATYTDQFGRESAPSPVVSVIASPLARIFRITVPPAYEFTNIYTTNADGTDFRRVITTRDSAVSITPAQRHEVLTTLGSYAMPAGIDNILWYDGRLYGAHYMSTADQTTLWCSDPFAYHLWRPAGEGIQLPGRVALLQRATKGIVIGTTKWVFHYDGEKLETLAEYGVVPGQAGDATAEGEVYFWTTRGFCKAMPFENITEKQLSVAPGTVAYSKMLYLNGMMQFVTLTDGGGQAFNQRTERE